MEQPNILSTNNDKISIIDTYTKIISETKWSLFAWLWYNQKNDKFYNKAYFISWQEITKEYITEQIQKWSEIVTNLNNIIPQIDAELLLNNTQKQLIKDLIQKHILLLQYHQNAIYIEAEKAWYKLSNKDRCIYRDEILRIENLLYWQDITHLTERKNKVIDKLYEIYQTNHQVLTLDEQEIRQEKILNKFSQPLSISNKIDTPAKTDIYIDEKHVFELVALLLEIEWFKAEDIINIQINNNIQDISFDQKTWIYTIPDTRTDKEVYAYFKKEGMDQKFKVIKKNIWNSSVSITQKDGKFGKNHINLPAPIKGKYNITKKLLPIIYDHEISTHVNTQIGNINNIYIQDPERSDLEEWVALFNQAMASDQNIESLYEASIWDIWMFLWEHFDEHDLQQLLDIYFKLSKDTNQNIWDRVRRIKMWVPLWEKWARRKDLTYGNSKEIIKELEQLTKTPEGIDLLNTYAKAIYSTKLGYEAIQNIDQILDGITTLDKLEPNFPIFAGKIIYWKLFKWKLDTNKMLENDLRRYIKTDTNVSIAQKKLIIKIINIIKTYWEEAIQ